MITVNLNGEIQAIKEDSKLSSLLMQLNISPKGIAVAINQAVVPKQNWETTTLKKQDQILIIKATQGG